MDAMVFASLDLQGQSPRAHTQFVLRGLVIEPSKEFSDSLIRVLVHAQFSLPRFGVACVVRRCSAMVGVRYLVDQDE